MPATSAPAVPGLKVTIGGGPGADREVSLSLSPSRAGDFMRCPLLFRFRALDRLPERPGSAAARGSLVHEVLDRLFDLAAASRTRPAAEALIRPTWESMIEADPVLACAVDESFPFPCPEDRASALDPGLESEWLAGATRLLDAYFELEDPTRLEPAARELALSAQLDDGPPLKGIVDRLDVSAEGLVRVVDYKTGRSPRAGFEQRSMFQMRFYALILWRSRGSVPTRLQLLYLGDRQRISYDPTEAQLESFESKVRALWEAITAALRSGDWRPSPSRLCGWCDHHALCPAKGGVAPPLPIVELLAPS